MASLPPSAAGCYGVDDVPDRVVSDFVLLCHVRSVTVFRTSMRFRGLDQPSRPPMDQNAVRRCAHRRAVAPAAGKNGRMPFRQPDAPSRLAAVRRYRPPASLLALYGIAMLFRAAQNMAQTSIAPIGETNAHLPTAVIGGIIAVTGVVTVGVTLYGGRKARQESVHKWLWAGLALTAASLPVLAVSRSWLTLLVGSCVLGAGGGLAFPSITTLVGHHGSSSPQRRMAAFALALSISLSIGPLLDSAVLSVSHDSLGVALVVFTALPLLSLVLIPAGRPRDHRAGAQPAPPLETAVALDLPTGAPVPLAPPERESSDGPAPPPWRMRGWRLAVAAQLLYQVPFVAVISFGVVAGEHLDGVHLAEAQLGISAFFALSMLTRAAVTARRPIERPRSAVLVVAALTMVGVTLFAFGQSAALMFVALGVLGIPHGLVYPVALGLIADETPPAQLVRANAAFSACTSTVSAVMPAVLGALGAAAGLRVMFLALLVPVAGIGLLVAGWSGLRLEPPAPDRELTLR